MSHRPYVSLSGELLLRNTSNLHLSPSPSPSLSSPPSKPKDLNILPLRELDSVHYIQTLFEPLKLKLVLISGLRLKLDLGKLEIGTFPSPDLYFQLFSNLSPHT